MSKLLSLSELKQNFVGVVYDDEDGKWEITDVIYNPIKETGQIYEACITKIEDDVEGNPNAGFESGVDIREPIYFLNNKSWWIFDEELYKQIYKDPRFGIPEEVEEDEDCD